MDTKNNKTGKKPSLSCVVVLVNSNLKTVPLKKKSLVETSPHLILPPDNTSCPAFEDITLRAGIKNFSGYKMIASWPCSPGTHLRMYAKSDGRVNLLNQFLFLSPADNQQFYGVCLIVRVMDDTNQVVHMDKSMFQSVYTSQEQLQLQLQNADADIDADTDNDNDADSNKRLTSCGYKLDGFVVGDDDTFVSKPKCSDHEEDADDESDNAVTVSVAAAAAASVKKAKKAERDNKSVGRVDTVRHISSATAKRHAAAAATAAAISLNTDATIEILAELVAEDYI